VDVSINHCMAFLIALLALARVGEQIYWLRQCKAAPVNPSTTDRRSSVISPMSSAATLIYGYSNGAEMAVLVAAWGSAGATFMSWAIARGYLQSVARFIADARRGRSDD
jgi:hypothetical protein